MIVNWIETSPNGDAISTILDRYERFNTRNKWQ
jgi:hypothetical protein